MRTRRLVSLMVAVVAGIIWVLSTSANATNSWEPINFLLRIAAGTVTVAAAVEWSWLSVREDRENREAREDRAVDGDRVDRVLDPGVGASRPPAPHAARSAGSRTVLDNLLSLFGRRRRSATEDLAVVAGGGAVVVVAYLMERKVRRVSLRVGLDEASVESLEAALGAAPHRVFGTQTPTRGLFERSAFTQIEGASRSGAWSISVPTQDVDVLCYALSRADEIR